MSISRRISSAPVRVGVVGTGWVATARHIPAFKRDGRSTIVALLDRDRSQAESVARKFRIPQSFNRMEDFLETPLDVVSICTPPWTHAPLVEAAIRTGKHVLVEKPMTMTSEEGKYLETLARESSVLLCPAHNLLFARSIQRAKSLLERGEAGVVHGAMGVQLSSWLRRLPTWFKELPGGLFFDEAPHLLYLMRYFLGDLQVEQAWHSTRETDSALPTERMETRLCGARGTGHLTMWTGSPFSEWLLILFCSRAVLVMDLFRDILVNIPPERAHNAGDVLKSSVYNTLRFWQGIGASGLRFTFNRLLYGHDRLVNSFLDVVLNGGEPPISAQDGWTVVALMEDILHRASEGGT